MRAGYILTYKKRRRRISIRGAIVYVLGDVRYEERPDPGKMLDMVQPFAPLAEGYRAMDERRAIKVLLHP
jgi:hypothetical protein